MTFSAFCTGTIITILLILAAILLDGWFTLLFNDAAFEEHFGFISIAILGIGFGVCFTMLLYQNGLLT